LLGLIFSGASSQPSAPDYPGLFDKPLPDRLFGWRVPKQVLQYLPCGFFHAAEYGIRRFPGLVGGFWTVLLKTRVLSELKHRGF
jgi:hypothetical protein